MQHRGWASEWPGTEFIPSENINQGSDKKLSYSFRKVPRLLHGGNNQNSLGILDQNQIVRGFKKNRLRLALIKKSDTEYTPHRIQILEKSPGSRSDARHPENRKEQVVM